MTQIKLCVYFYIHVAFRLTLFAARLFCHLRFKLKKFVESLGMYTNVI